MLRETTPRRSVAAIERLAREVSDPRRLRAAILDELRRTVPFDWYVWVLTDPATAVGTDPLAEVPDLAQLPKTIRLKYLTKRNRWTDLDGVAVLGQHAGDSLLWREEQRRHGVVDVASLVLRDRFGCWAFLDLWSRSPYDGHDVAFLREVAPTLTTALRVRQARRFQFVPPAHGPTRGPVVLLLDDDLRITAQTTGTGDWLSALLPRSDGPPVPAAAYNVAGQLLAQEAGVDAHEAMGRVALEDGLWLTVRASRLAQGRQLAVTIQPTTPHDRLDVFARAAGLTQREGELLTHLAHGADTREVAEVMSLSPHTVQDHLKSVFAKTGTSSRRTLMARALGVQP